MSSQTILIPGALSIGDIVDRAFRIYRARFKPMVLTALAILAPIALVTAALNYILTVQVLNADPTDVLPALLTMLGTLAVVVLAGLGQGLAELALLFHALAALRNVPLRPGEAISAAGGRIWSWLGMTLLQALAYGGLLVVLFVVLILPTAALSAVESNAGFGILLCCYPLVMLAIGSFSCTC